MTGRERGAESSTWYADGGAWMGEINRKLRKRPAYGPEPTDEDRLYDGTVDDDHEPTPYCADLWDDPEEMNA